MSYSSAAVATLQIFLLRIAFPHLSRGVEQGRRRSFAPVTRSQFPQSTRLHETSQNGTETQDGANLHLTQSVSTGQCVWGMNWMVLASVRGRRRPEMALRQPVISPNRGFETLQWSQTAYLAVMGSNVI